MSNKKNISNYKGILKEPLSPGVQLKINEEKFEEDIWPRIQALFSHYGINPSEKNNEKKLILAMAKEHVPGFQKELDKPRVGAPRKWRGHDGLKLYVDVLSYTVNGSSIGEACLRLSQKQEYQKYSPATLKARFLETKREYPIVQFFESIRKHHSNVEIDNLIIDYFSTGTEK